MKLIDVKKYDSLYIRPVDINEHDFFSLELMEKP